MFQLDPDNATSVVRGTLILHNIMRDRYPAAQNAEIDAPPGAPGSWRAAGVMAEVEAEARGTRASKDGKQLRAYLKHYYNSPVGSVPWQEAAIERGNQ